ncbi:LysR substrate-binding domain-containing protein [Bosea sp. NPDC055594]
MLLVWCWAMGFHPSKARLPVQLFAVTLSASGGRTPLPAAPQDLLGHNCVLMSRLGMNANEWSFVVEGTPLKLKVQGNYVVNGGHGNYEAVIAGLGIGRMTDLRVLEDIRAGRLEPILREFEPQEAMPIYAAYKSTSLVPPKIRIFIDYLRHRIRPSSG